MPRPKKCRKVCHLPPNAELLPRNDYNGGTVILTVDEYECIRLADYQGFSQEECAEHMQISRATAQLICDSAHKKIAEALVRGFGIRIDGGDYRLESSCDCGGCKKRRPRIHT